jgi:hypothetical protein
MPDPGNPFLLSIIILTSVIYGIINFYSNRYSVHHQDNSPLQQAKRAWKNANPKKRNDFEVDLDLLILDEMNKANDFCTLCNIYEEGLTYTKFFIFQKHREVTPIICAGYTNRYEVIKEKMKEARKAQDIERRKHKDDHRAPRPQKIEGRGQVRVGNVCNLSTLKKINVSESGASQQIH